MNPAAPVTRHFIAVSASEWTSALNPDHLNTNGDSSEVGPPRLLVRLRGAGALGYNPKDMSANWKREPLMKPAIIDRGRGPEIAGSRITVYDVLAETQAGATPEELARWYQLDVAQIRLALDY